MLFCVSWAVFSVSCAVVSLKSMHSVSLVTLEYFSFFDISLLLNKKSQLTIFQISLNKL